MKAYASDLIATAESQVGYHEKASNANLDSNTANSGSNNYTKYARDIYSKYPTFYNGNKNGYAWCDLFYDWCMLTAFGLDKTLELTCQPLKSAGAGCIYSYSYYKAKGRVGETPKLGAQIFFGSAPSNLYHTGMVVKYDNTYVYTIEGNSNDQVSRCTYRRTNSTIYGYGYPAFDGDTNPSGSTSTTTTTTSSSTTTSKTTTTTSTGISKTVQWTGSVNQDVIPRSWAGATNSTLKSISKITKGTSVGVCDTIADSSGANWYYVLINSKIYGFIPASSVTNTTATITVGNGSNLNKTSKFIGVVTADSLNVRTWAGTKYSRLISIPAITNGTTVQVCDAVYDSSNHVWYYICINGTTYGFVDSTYISAADGTIVKASSTTTTSSKTSSSTSTVTLTSDSRKTT
jgi:hypothetical protein